MTKNMMAEKLTNGHMTTLLNKKIFHFKVKIYQFKLNIIEIKKLLLHFCGLLLEY